MALATETGGRPRPLDGMLYVIKQNGVNYMPKYRKKPVVIEAWMWRGNTPEDAKCFCRDNGLPDFPVGSNGEKTGLVIDTLEGRHIASNGDFIIKGIAGEYYPCKPDIFHATYDLVEG